MTHNPSPSSSPQIEHDSASHIPAPCLLLQLPSSSSPSSLPALTFHLAHPTIQICTISLFSICLPPAPRTLHKQPTLLQIPHLRNQHQAVAQELLHTQSLPITQLIPHPYQAVVQSRLTTQSPFHFHSSDHSASRSEDSPRKKSHDWHSVSPSSIHSSLHKHS